MSKVIHVAPWMDTDDPRILRARDTWNVLFSDYGWMSVRPTIYTRNDDAPSDPRRLILIRSLLDLANDWAAVDDVIVLTCDDIILRPCVDAQIREVSLRCSLFTGHRANCDTFDEALNAGTPTEINEGRVLIGCCEKYWHGIRDLIPPIHCGTGQSDLYVAALARSLAGRCWTQQNSTIYEPACELAPGCIWHERHTPSWDESMPTDIHDRKLVAEAFKEHLPEMLPPYLKDL